MYLKLNGVEICCTGSECWEDLLERLPDGGVGALGVSVQGRTYSLTEPVVEYAYAHVLTFEDEEGRRIYERSLQLREQSGNFIYASADRRFVRYAGRTG